MRDMTRRFASRLPRVLVAIATMLLAGCTRFHSVAIGPGGEPVSSLRKGTMVDLRFAAPRRLAARTSGSSSALPPNAIRVVGTVERAHDDTLFVRVERVAALGGKLRDVIPPVTAPVIIDRDVAVRVRR